MKKRRYEQRKRAESVAETRHRITAAAVDLHGTLGPARTSMSAVAERAGVTRVTLYRHFSDESALFAACSSDWRASHPAPDLGKLADVTDPNERLSRALTDLTAFYRRNERMLTNLYRDVDALPPATRKSFLAMTSRFREALLPGYPSRGPRGRAVRAAIGHAVSFETWRSLALEQGLRDREIVDLLCRFVNAAAD